MPPVGDGRLEQAPEHGVGGDEQPAEEEQEREADRQPAPDRSGPLTAHARVQPLPGEVALHHLERTGERRCAGGRRARDVVGDLGVRDRALGPAQGAERDRAGDREQVGRDEQGRVVPGEKCGEQQQRRDHVAPALVQRDRADL